MTFTNNMGRYQAPQQGGLDLRSILFDTQHQNLLKTSSIALGDLNSGMIEILSIYQVVPEL